MSHGKTRGLLLSITLSAVACTTAVDSPEGPRDPDATELGTLSALGDCGSWTTNECDSARDALPERQALCDAAGGSGEYCSEAAQVRIAIGRFCGCGLEPRQSGNYDYQHASGIEVREHYYCSDDCQPVDQPQGDGWVNDRSGAGCGYNGCSGTSCQQNFCR